ncbi:hypothetical protein RclHR1_01880002 [Rhizophagus clarus]|nr:hypothetical protein RclHR1_01880002 [Rhizophagus clarus]
MSKKYGFQYQYITNSFSLKGILDITRKSSIISLNRLKKHQIDTKSLIKRLTKTSYNKNEDQYNEINYNDIEGIIMDFHIFLGIEKMNITLKKVLVIKNYIDDNDDENFGFILGTDFMKEFDVEIEDVHDVYDERSLHRLKFTIQLNDIDDINEMDYNNFESVKDDAKSISSFVDDFTYEGAAAYASTSKNLKVKKKTATFRKKFKDNARTQDNTHGNSSIQDNTNKNSSTRDYTNESFSTQDNKQENSSTCTKYYYMIAAFILFLGFIGSIFNDNKYQKECLLIFEDKIDWLIILEEGIIPKTSLPRIYTNKSCLNVLNKSSLFQSNDLKPITDNVVYLRALHKLILDNYGNDLWELRERHIKDIKTISNTILNQHQSFLSISKSYSISKNYKIKNLIKKMKDIRITLTILIDSIKKAQSKWEKPSPGEVNCLNLLMAELTYIESYTEELREKIPIIDHVFMKLKDDIIRILKERDFGYYEIKIINRYLGLVQTFRRSYLIRNGLELR